MSIQISFIVPVYNIEAYIKDCLASLSTLKAENIEVILVDDGSTDHSGEICEQYAKADHRFTVLHQENRGLSGARNTGLKHATGEWICFVDGDDEVEANFTEKLSWPAYQACDVVFFRLSRRDSSGVVQKQYNDNYSGKLKETAYTEWLRILLDADWKAPSNIIPQTLPLAEAWCKMYRRQFLIDNNILFPEQLKTTQEDICFNSTICLCHPSLYVENIYAYIYRYVSTSIMHRYSPEVSNRTMYAYQYIASRINNNPETKGEYDNFLYLRAIRNFLICCAMDFFHPQNPNNEKVRKKAFLALRNHEIYQKAFDRGDIKSIRPSVRIGAILCKYKLFKLYKVAWNIANLLGVSHA